MVFLSIVHVYWYVNFRGLFFSRVTRVTRVWIYGVAYGTMSRTQRCPVRNAQNTGVSEFFMWCCYHVCMWLEGVSEMLLYQKMLVVLYWVIINAIFTNPYFCYNFRLEITHSFSILSAVKASMSKKSTQRSCEFRKRQLEKEDFDIMKHRKVESERVKLT